MGLCRQFISGQNDLWSNWPICFNSFASCHCAFFIFSHAIFCTEPVLSECLQEATHIPGRVLPEKKNEWGLCGPLPKTSTPFKTKVCNCPFSTQKFMFIPVSDLPYN